MILRKHYIPLLQLTQKYRYYYALYGILYPESLGDKLFFIKNVICKNYQKCNLDPDANAQLNLSNVFVERLHFENTDNVDFKIIVFLKDKAFKAEGTFSTEDS